MGYLSILILLSVALVVLVGTRLAKRQESPTVMDARRGVLMIAVALLVVASLYRSVLGVFIIPSTSMSPTLETGDRIIVNKFIYKLRSPARNDVIVFHAPESVREDDGDEFLVKRVIGLPGETIQVFNRQVWINDRALSEDYLRPSHMVNTPPVTVPEGSVFVMGDNRDDSSDSREWGPVELKLIVGRANLIVSPRSRFGYIR